MAKVTLKPEALKGLLGEITSGAGWNGQLTPNEIWAKIFNKLSTMRIFSTFEFSNKIFQRYVKASSLVGDYSELVSFGVMDPTEMPTSLTFEEYIGDYFPKEWVNVAKFNIDIRSNWTLKDVEMYAAVDSEAKFGSLVQAIMQSIENGIELWMYRKIIDTYKNTYKNIIEIEVNSTDTDEEVAYKITAKMLEVSQDMTLPNDKYNVIPQDGQLKLNATPLSDQQLTWNLPNKIKFDMQVAKVFHGKSIPHIGSLITTAIDANFEDDSIVAVLDTPQTIYIGQKSQPLNSSDRIGAMFKTNFYRRHIMESAVVGYTNGVVFKLKVNTPSTTTE